MPKWETSIPIPGDMSLDTLRSIVEMIRGDATVDDFSLSPVAISRIDVFIDGDALSPIEQPPDAADAPVTVRAYVPPRDFDLYDLALLVAGWESELSSYGHHISIQRPWEVAESALSDASAED